MLLFFASELGYLELIYLKFISMVNLFYLYVFAQDIHGSGSVKISGNKLGGSLKLNYFSMSLKWSNIGNLRLYLVQVQRVTM